MSVQEYLIEITNKLVQKFPSTRVRYENNQLSYTHFVEVVPNEIYRLNSDFQKWEEETVFNFIRLFPDQNICFISDDALVPLTEVIYQAQGVLFDLKNQDSDVCYNETIKVVAEINGASVNNMVSSLRPLIVSNGLGELSFNVSKISLLGNDNLVAIIESTSVIEQTGESNYAMAA